MLLSSIRLGPIVSRIFIYFVTLVTKGNYPPIQIERKMGKIILPIFT